VADNSIDDIVLERIYKDGLDKSAADYVLAALEGTLDEVLDTGGRDATPRPDTPETPAGAYLRRVSVAGFRGIGPPADLEVVPGPGLTLVVGANGTGKSSFAEGLEFLLTGRNSRWQDKSAEWRQGWRNLHAQDPPGLEARFTVDGQPEDAVVSRRWESVTAGIEHHTLEGLEDLEWSVALNTHRPFLSYDQLNDIVDNRPSDRFDAMAAGLGLERLTEAHEQLRTQRLNDQRAYREAREQRDELLEELEALDDERAFRVRAALVDEPWDLERIHLAFEGVLDEDADRPMDLLRRLATLEFPSSEEIRGLSDELQSWVEDFDWDELEGSNAAQAARLTEVLRAALRLHEHDGDQPCPVCETGHLDVHWKTVADKRRRALDAEAESVNRMASELDRLLRDAHSLCIPTPDFLADADRVGIDASAVKTVWDRWSGSLTEEPGLPRLDKREIATWTEEQGWGMDVDSYGVTLHGGPVQFTNPLTKRGVLEVAGRLTERGARVRDELVPLRESAQAELDRRENLWRPLRRQLLEWLPTARRGQKAAARLTDVQAAADWLTHVEDDVRAERFRPIAERARRYWETMGKGSSVSLDDLTLAGQANRRHLEIATSVDGQETPALAVMSQGELNALSLSLFLARALLPESPFRFLVIDDPVQAMDPTKVEGLARVLAEAAAERQIIVFTHDERLPAAARRLRIEHRLLAVTRRENSQVQCQPVQEPVQRHLDDAHAVWLTDSLDDQTRQRVIPGFCRQALEAACLEAVWRNRTATGHDFARTEQDVIHAQTLNDKLKLVLLDDLNGDHQAMRTTLYKDFGRRAQDIVDACNRGAHGHWHGGMDGLINGTEWLAKRILTHRAQ